eukprot:CAMPEP_0194144096 /NCGR_PEP_ID=MMETSP0152-20130528/13175_1 /TAXON_ID=1049557 /ORGANISM="Thalassiothrix antarctica, Strain L6-D1" /LENGTH=194 /DNA_ID=CAMNT_0038843787 /DNA_START=50 /DNA_END=634 /DNA_ORIENTATION=+
MRVLRATTTSSSSFLLVLFVWNNNIFSIKGFQMTSPFSSSSSLSSLLSGASKSNEENIINDDDEDQTYSFSTSSAKYVIDSGLIPPPINIKKESILFDDSSATADNNNALKIWKGMKARFPRVLTGASSSEIGNDNPIGAIYNTLFVRMPVVLSGILYSKNLFIDGHPLVVDFGEGPITMNPLIVFAFLYVFLK